MPVTGDCQPYFPVISLPLPSCPAVYHGSENLVLHKAILASDKIKIALYGRPPEIGQLPIYESEIRSLYNLKICD